MKITLPLLTCLLIANSLLAQWTSNTDVGMGQFQGGIDSRLVFYSGQHQGDDKWSSPYGDLSLASKIKVKISA